MGITIPDNIPFPDAGTALPPLETHFAALAEGAQAAITNLRGSTAPPVASAAARNALYPSPVQGNQVFRLDKGYTEMYYSEYSSGSNPGGVTPPDWYPIAGKLPAGLIKIGTSGSQSIAANVMVLVNCFTVTDGGYAHGVGVESGALRILTGGKYHVRGSVNFNTSASGIRVVELTKNSVTDAGQISYSAPIPATSVAYTTVSTDAVVDLLPDDVIRIMAFQNSGANLSLMNKGGSAAAATQNFLEVRYIGPPTT